MADQKSLSRDDQLRIDLDNIPNNILYVFVEQSDKKCKTIGIFSDNDIKAHHCKNFRDFILFGISDDELYEYKTKDLMTIVQKQANLFNNILKRKINNTKKEKDLKNPESDELRSLYRSSISGNFEKKNLSQSIKERQKESKRKNADDLKIAKGIKLTETSKPDELRLWALSKGLSEKCAKNIMKFSIKESKDVLITAKMLKNMAPNILDRTKLRNCLIEINIDCELITGSRLTKDSSTEDVYQWCLSYGFETADLWKSKDVNGSILLKGELESSNKQNLFKKLLKSINLKV